jgi:hypothetical protein
MQARYITAMQALLGIYTYKHGFFCYSGNIIPASIQLFGHSSHTKA